MRASPLKALYQYISVKNRNHDVFCIFLGQENGNVHIRAPHIVVCDVTITPLARAWPAGLALCPRSGERPSEIDIVRILRGAEESVCFSFLYRAFISGLTCHHKVR